MTDDAKEEIQWDAFAESRQMRTPKSELPCGGDNCHVGALWTRDDYITLIKMAKPGTKVSDICLELRRSKAGVVAALGRIRIAFSVAHEVKHQCQTDRLVFGSVVYASNLTVKKFDLLQVFIDEGWEPEYYVGRDADKVKFCVNPYKSKFMGMGEFEQSIFRRNSENERKRRQSGKNQKQD